MPKLFISYRREDSEDVTGRIVDNLSPRFDKESVFIDVDSIPAGADFRHHVKEHIHQCDVLVAVIGPEWAAIKYTKGQKAGTRRLDDPEDFLRIEIETALAHAIPILPVLVKGAAMPSKENLPSSLEALSFRNATPMGSGRDFHPSMQRLFHDLDALLNDESKISYQNAAAKATKRLNTKINPHGDFDYDACKLATRLLYECEETVGQRLLTQVKKFTSGEINESTFTAFLKAETELEVARGRNYLVPAKERDADGVAADFAAKKISAPNRATEAEAKSVRLAKWITSGQPRKWVRKHGGRWNHRDWTALLDELRHTEFWPLDEPAMGNVLETERLIQLEEIEEARREAVRQVAERKREDEARRAAENAAEAARSRKAEEIKAKSARLTKWIADGHPAAWVKARAGRWDHDAWCVLLEGLRRSEFWPLDESAVGAELEVAKRAYLQEAERLRTQQLAAEQKRQEEVRRATEAEASRFRAELERSRRQPTVRFIAIVDGKEVIGAKVSDGAGAWKTPIVLTLQEGASYPFKVAYIDRNGLEYSGESQLTATWAGEQLIQVNLQRTNSLGVKFVPVPRMGVLFSVWDVRVKDYAVFAQANSGMDTSWRNPGFSQNDNHPVVNVSWGDAQAFCKWLTEKERSEGRIKTKYRLPTDWEWSVAAGLANEQDGTPERKDSKTLGVYPWGTQWPPPKEAGNYCPRLNVDDFTHTSPVGSFAANLFGLYDMGGNVWQWCEDFYDGRTGAHVLRGASWDDFHANCLLSSYRLGSMSGIRNNRFGMRVVLETP